MRFTSFLAAAMGLAFALGMPASAQEGTGLPAACLPEAAGHGDHGGHAAPATDAPLADLDEAHSALSAGMDRMHAEMASGMQAEDIDVAFVCGMLPHHQGAIDMARAVLAHGDDPWVRTLAEQIIAAQEKEIADMRAWLEDTAR